MVGRVVFEQGFELLHGLARVHQGRQAQRELESGVGPQHVARVFEGGKTVGAGHAQRGPPGAVEQGLHRVLGGGQGEGGGAFAVVVRPGKALVELVAQNLRGGLGLGQAVGGHFAMKARGQETPGGAVFQPVEQLAHDAKAGRHQAAGVARVNAFGEHLHLERARGHAAQAGGQPQLVVVTGARIQANDQPHLAQARLERVHIGQQVVRAAFLAGLDQAHDARVSHALAFERLHGGNAGVNGVAIVGAAAAIKLAVFIVGGPGAQVGAPA